MLVIIFSSYYGFLGIWLHYSKVYITQNFIHLICVVWSCLKYFVWRNYFEILFSLIFIPCNKFVIILNCYSYYSINIPVYNHVHFIIWYFDFINYICKDLYLLWKALKVSCYCWILIWGTTIGENGTKSSHWASFSINILTTFQSFFMNTYYFNTKSFFLTTALFGQWLRHLSS